MPLMTVPTTRPRRLRASPELRALVRETELNPGDFVLPLFIRPGKGEKRPISSMPSHIQYSVDEAVKAAGEANKHNKPTKNHNNNPNKKNTKTSSTNTNNGIVQ